MTYDRKVPPARAVPPYTDRRGGRIRRTGVSMATPCLRPGTRGNT
ncbi:hypothetical protein SUDANB58_02965 [Streptomyces sp. enrichment culture]